MKKVTLSSNLNKNVDWLIPQWVALDENPNLIVLTTGTFTENSFEGTCLPCNDYPNGNHNTNWNKKLFHKLERDVNFIISNND